MIEIRFRREVANVIEAPAVPPKKQPKPPEPPAPAPDTSKTEGDGKRGPGRPTFTGEAMDVVSFRLPRDVLAALDLWVQEENAKPDPKRANRNTVVLYALREELVKRGLLAKASS